MTIEQSKLISAVAKSGLGLNDFTKIAELVEALGLANIAEGGHSNTELALHIEARVNAITGMLRGLDELLEASGK